MSEKIYSQEEFDMWRKDYEKNCFIHKTAPETKEELGKIHDSIKEVIDTKLDKSLFWKIFTLLIPILIAVTGHLYVIYYSGIANLGKGIAVIEERTENMRENISEIKREIEMATRPE